MKRKEKEEEKEMERREEGDGYWCEKCLVHSLTCSRELLVRERVT
jgi:hypothetical protein